MPYLTNNHVDRLHRYLPFDASHDQIYEENRVSGDSLEIETRALVYLKQVINDKTGLIILTGDAGHGKTHLCSRLIKDHLGYTSDLARTTVRERCDGGELKPVEEFAHKRTLRIFKDFSEPTVDVARILLANAISETGATTIVCVNEGRLRSILAGAEDQRLVTLQRSFFASFESGLASTDGVTHIVNLNYQSVAVDENAVLERVLSGEGQRLGWLAARRWSICDTCDAKAGCPINRNASLLRGDEATLKRARLREVVSIAERLGTVITIREILMMVAYLLTGGLRCKDVHKKYSQRRTGGWQHEYIYYNLLFKPPAGVSRDKLARIPVLKSIAPIDPGLVSERRIDDRLINDADVFPDAGFELILVERLGGQDLRVDATNGIDEIVANARSRDERDTEAEFTKEVIRNLRRRDFFENSDDPNSDAERLGFRYYGDFKWMLAKQQGNNRKVRIKNRLIAGLHTIQGLRLPSSESMLHLVDPAFGRSTNRAAIIARKIPSQKIRLVPESEGWEIPEEKQLHAMEKVVDWIDRTILLTVEVTDLRTENYPMDLLTFDCIMRASSGYLPEAFYSHDVRRIMNFLGLLAEGNIQNGQESIDVMVGGQMHTVVLEEGDVIVVSGNSL